MTLRCFDFWILVKIRKFWILFQLSRFKNWIFRLLEFFSDILVITSQSQNWNWPRFGIVLRKTLMFHTRFSCIQEVLWGFFVSRKKWKTTSFANFLRSWPHVKSLRHRGFEWKMIACTLIFDKSSSIACESDYNAFVFADYQLGISSKVSRALQRAAWTIFYTCDK